MAMFRFSHWVVAEGKVPSTGKLDTGNWLPRRAMIGATTSLTNSGASGATTGGMSKSLVTLSTTSTRNRLAMAWSTAAKLR